MLISIGTKSVPKLIGAMRAFSNYPEIFINDGSLEFVSYEFQSDVSANPISLEEIIQGAKYRAKVAFDNAKDDGRTCSYGVGIESGIYLVPETHSGYMDTTAGVLYDGKEYYIGLGPSFEYPKKAIDRVLNNGEEIGHMEDIFGTTAKGKRGAIGELSNDRISRDRLMEDSVTMALIQIINKDKYRNN